MRRSHQAKANAKSLLWNYLEHIHTKRYATHASYKLYLAVARLQSASERRAGSLGRHTGSTDLGLSGMPQKQLGTHHPGLI